MSGCCYGMHSNICWLHRPAVSLVVACLLAAAACIRVFWIFCLADSQSNNYLQCFFEQDLVLWWSALAIILAAAACAILLLCCWVRRLTLSCFGFLFGCQAVKQLFASLFLGRMLCVVSVFASIVWPRGGLQ